MNIPRLSLKTRFVRVCLEIDHARPLKRGFLVEDRGTRVFPVILYERLPTFCFTCVVVGHEENTVAAGQRLWLKTSRWGIPSTEKNPFEDVEITLKVPISKRALLRIPMIRSPWEDYWEKETKFFPWMLATHMRSRGRVMEAPVLQLQVLLMWHILEMMAQNRPLDPIWMIHILPL